MTTIATDGRTMAGDGRCSANGRIVSDRFVKLLRLDDGRIVGACGDTSNIRDFRKWLGAGQTGSIKVASDFEALVMSADGAVMHYDSDLSPVPADMPMAIGSGGRFAIGAMLAGVDPHDAVACAMKRDVYSGGSITVMSCDPT